MEEKVCKSCGRKLPIRKFRQCCDAYTGEKKWRRKTCKSCEYLKSRQYQQRATRQFTPASEGHKL